MRRTLRAVSLFTNCGAGDIGFASAGFQFDVIAELDARRLEVAKLNHPDARAVPGDLRSTWGLVRDRYRELRGAPPPDLLAACPPCQGMSSARSGRGKESDADAGSRDGRNLLVVPIAKTVQALKPRVVVVENVPAFLTRRVRDPETNRPISAARLLISILEHEYQVFAAVVDLADFGVPQNRRRCFLTFIRRDEKALKKLHALQVSPFPRPSHGTPGRRHVTLDHALAKMKLASLDSRNERLAGDRRRPLHSVPVWADMRYKMVMAIPSRSGLSAWENERCVRCGRVEVRDDDATCPKCRGPLLRPVIQEDDGTWRLINGFRSTSYRRMAVDRPASTITTASGHVGSDLTIHPWEHRVLSPLECAELQTIPRSFDWGESLSRFGSTFVREMIGEAVPPRYTERHGRVIAKLLSGQVDRSFLPSQDDRCTRARAKLDATASDDKVTQEKRRTR